ncbi:hypothetical protein SAMD00019534_002750 [Acytostelium subglobosum LB1]|uniref:hypothetical protein n=1 Tax=Acytostelium subglobosum LB1 TaxID=1410327 RepID=UPI000644B98B|nr:hypothetical protein SAMD00019534_002750 [Acytostelium subglobosum LB1]GAM17100.1 hypothetical protein SAMD00019534_002750 [Acytostelium subglobosum LB1]|eukprot:XP_012759162.1 hypothetical protein SAMD00019534_002750 [Acytostelium subglobosum LB1]
MGYFSNLLGGGSNSNKDNKDNNKDTHNDDDLTDNSTTSTSSTTTTSDNKQHKQQQQHKTTTKKKKNVQEVEESEEKKQMREQYRKYQEMEMRKQELLIVARRAPEHLENVHRKEYNKMMLGDLNTPNPDSALWLSGTVTGVMGFLIANSFVKNNPIRGLRMFVVVGTTFATGYWGANTYYKARGDEIEEFRSRKMDYEDEQTFIKTAVQPKMYKNVLNAMEKDLDDRIAAEQQNSMANQ